MIIERILTRAFARHEAGTAHNYHDLYYELQDKFGITKSNAKNKTEECLSSAAIIIGLPVNLLPFEKGQSQQFVFGMFDLYFNNEVYCSCRNGNWPLTNIHEMAKFLYMDTGSNKWSVGDLTSIRHIITFEKITLAKRFWGNISPSERRHYMLLVTGGYPSFPFLLVRKFFYVAKMAHPFSYDLQHHLEANPNLWPIDHHLMMNMTMLGPMPQDSKFDLPPYRFVLYSFVSHYAYNRFDVFYHR